MPATVTHALSMTTPDDPAYENKPSNWNHTHAVTFNVLATEISALFSNQNGVSFGLDGTNITASIAAGGAPGSISAGTTRVALGEAVFSNSNGISFGLNGATVTAQHNALTSQSNQNVTAGNGGFAFQTLSFSNVNGVSFGTSAGSAITASHNGLTSQSNQAVSGQNGSSTFQTLSFGNANGISFGTDAAGFTASHNGLTSQSNQAMSAANGSFTFQTAQFHNSNGISWSSTTGSGIVASHNGITSQSNQVLSMYAVGNTTQSSSGTENASTLEFRGEGVASVGISNGSVVISVPAGGGGLTNINVSAGTTSNNLSALTFSNSNGVSFGLNGSTITASVNGAGGGATISQWPIQFSTSAQSRNSGTSGATGGSTQYTASLMAHPIIIPHALTFNNVAAVMSGQTSAGTGSATIGYFYGVYSLNASTALSRIMSMQFVAVISQNSITARTASWWWGTNSTSNSSSVNGNVSANFTAARRLLLSTGDSSLSGGQYWIVGGHTAQTVGIGQASSSLAGDQWILQPSVSGFGNAINVGSVQLYGTFTTTTNTNSTGFPILPLSINTSAIGFVNGPNFPLHIVFRSNQG